MVDWQDFSDYLDGWHKYSGYGMANCVWHADKNPSMRVSEKGYYCLSCGASGRLEKLYQKVANGVQLPPQKFYNPSAKIWDKWEQQFGDIKEICKIAHQSLVSNPDLGSYLYKRGLDTVSIKKGKLGFLEGYYVFPIRDEYGEVHGAVVRASPTIQTINNRYSVSPKCPIKLYVPDWSLVEKSEVLYICYGTLDAWSLFLAGYPALTGISGQELNSENLQRFRKPMFGISDLGEESNMARLQSALGWRMKILRLQYPDGCKDANDVHVKYGLDILKNLIETQKEIVHAK